MALGRISHHSPKKLSDAELLLLKTFILQHNAAIQRKLIQLLLPLEHFVSTYLKVHILQKSAIKLDYVLWLEAHEVQTN